MPLRIFFTFFCLFLSLAPTPVHAWPDPTVTTLENGLEVVVVPGSRGPAVQVMVWYHAGAVDEPKGRSGIAHFLEHLLFKETENLKSGELTQLIHGVGGESNAFTSPDFTVYHHTLHRDHLRLALLLEAERMQRVVLNEEEIETEREVVLEERLLRTDNNPRSQLQEEMRAALYAGHPYEAPVIGWRSEVEALTLEQIRSFYTRYYQPHHTTLLIVGSVDPTHATDLARELFGPLKNQHRKTRSPLPRQFHLAETVEQTITLESERVKQPQWMRYYLTPSITTPGAEADVFALIVLNQLIGGGERSLLYQWLVEHDGPATNAYSYYNDFTRAETNLGFYIGLKKAENISYVEQQITSLIQEITEQKIDPSALTRAITQLKADTIFAQDTLSHLASVYGNLYALGLNTSYLKTWNAQIDRITPEDIARVAKKYLTPDRAITGHLLPSPSPTAGPPS